MGWINHFQGRDIDAFGLLPSLKVFEGSPKCNCQFHKVLSSLVQTLGLITFNMNQVFDSARGREKQRKLLYPNACGGGGRGWISQGITGYGKVHVTRETCALHTARLSVETLVNFWSSLRAETQQSLLRMKEEDFIERLMFRCATLFLC